MPKLYMYGLLQLLKVLFSLYFLSNVTKTSNTSCIDDVFCSYVLVRDAAGRITGYTRKDAAECFPAHLGKCFVWMRLVFSIVSLRSHLPKLILKPSLNRDTESLHNTLSVHSSLVTAWSGMTWFTLKILVYLHFGTTSSKRCKQGTQIDIKK